MADFEEAAVSAFREVYGDVNVAGCWFHYAQTIVKRVNKRGLKADYRHDVAVTETVQCLLGLPLLPGAEIAHALVEVRSVIRGDSPRAPKLQELATYVQRHWLDKRTVGPQRLSVRDNRSRTNNVLESYHAALRRRIKVAHPNLFTFLGDIQRATVDYMTDVARANNGLSIHRPKKRSNLMNEARIKACNNKFDSGAYDRLQSLKTAGHSLGAHTPSLHDIFSSADSDDDDVEVPQPPSPTDAAATVASTTSSSEVADCCEVCLLMPRTSVALVPCGHSRFCSTCADTVAAMGNGCPLCRSRIDMVVRVYN